MYIQYVPDVYVEYVRKGTLCTYNMCILFNGEGTECKVLRSSAMSGLGRFLDNSTSKCERCFVREEILLWSSFD